MEKGKAISSLKQILINSKKLFGLAYRTDKKLLILYLITTVIGALVPLGFSLIYKLLLDSLEFSHDASLSSIPFIIIALLAGQYLIGLANSLIFWAFNQTYLDYILRYKLQNEITLKFHQKIAGLDIAHFENPKTQDLISKTRDTMQWRLPDFIRTFFYLISSIVGYIAAFAALVQFGWWIPVIITVITIPRLYLQAKYGAIQWSIWGSGAPQAKKLWYFNYILQDPMTVRETRISQASASLLKKFKEIQLYLFGLSKKALDKNLRASTIPPLIEMIFIFLIAYQFLPSVLVGTLTIGSFTLLISMLQQLGDRSADASSHFAQIYEGNLYVNHYFEFLALPRLIKEPENPVILTGNKPPKIEFRNVSFAYNDGPKVLNKISFTIEPGQSVALVGHNGAGKTTIIKLLCRFYDVTEGEILINGINIKNIKLSEWYKFMGTLFQEFVRYHFTVRENISLGSSKPVDESAMIEAAKKADADMFINSLPNKYDQILGKEFEDGIEISGGQWQKIAIARAFYENPPILILDEPTSSIDAEAEFNIFNNIVEQYKDKTLIVVSHRFSTVRNTQKIIVLSEGKIIETGNHENLMSKNGEYAKLFTFQAKGYQ